jgi:hypothetical protein
MTMIDIESEVERWEVEAKCRWEGRQCSTPRAACGNKSQEVMERAEEGNYLVK